MANSVIKPNRDIASKTYSNIGEGVIVTDIPINRVISCVPTNWDGVAIHVTGHTSEGYAKLTLKSAGADYVTVTDTRVSVRVSYWTY